jgi:hypothetical protein
MTIADINTLSRFLTSTTSNNFTDAQLLILVNKYYEEVTGQILSHTSGGQSLFGDFNKTAFPTYTITMTNSQAEYDLRDWGTTDIATPLVIIGAEVLDQDGNWHVLKRTSLKEIHEEGWAQTEYYETDAQPYFYEIRDNHIVLYPAPDNGVSVTLANGLKLFFLTTADKYTSGEVTTGTKEPGFPSPWHDLLAYGPAYDYAIANGLPNANHLKAAYDQRMKELLTFMSNRDKDSNKRITTKPILYV